MTNAPDWLSDSRAGILAMAQAWCTIFQEQVKNEKGEEAAKYAAWGIPFTVFSLFMETYDAARNALQVALNEETRTKITTSACKDAFTELEAQMRSIKKRYSMGRHGWRVEQALAGVCSANSKTKNPHGSGFFVLPPLSRQDYQSLGLNLPSTGRNPSGEPDSQARVVVFLTGGFHEIGIIFEHITGSPSDPANKEYRLYYKLISPGEPKPKSVKELTESFGTKRKRDALPLEPEDSGKKIFMAPRIENGRLKGLWGPLVSTFVP